MNTMNLIFDLDGTLWDAAPAIAKGWNDVLKRPVPLTSQDIRQVAGLPMDAIFKRLAIPDDPELLERLITAEHDMIEQLGAELFPGVRKTLEQLTRWYPLYIVSNCQQGYIELFLRTMEVSHLFRDHLCWGDTLAPKSVTIKQLMARHRMEQAVYIGDTSGDQVAAAEAGIPFIFVNYGFGQADEPVTRIDHLSQLLEVYSCP